MAAEANAIAVNQAPQFKPLPHREHTRPLADFAPQFKAAAQAQEAARLPTASLPAQEAARIAPRPAVEQPVQPTARRGAVPQRLVDLMQAARGREAMAGIRPAPRHAAAAVQAPPIRENAAHGLAAAPRPAPRAAAEPPVRLNALNRPANAAPRPLPRTIEVDQEIQQLNARQNLQTAMRERAARAEGGAGNRRIERNLLDQRV